MSNFMRLIRSPDVATFVASRIIERRNFARFSFDLRRRKDRMNNAAATSSGNGGSRRLTIVSARLLCGWAALKQDTIRR